jgi:hypothetical protein
MNKKLMISTLLFIMFLGGLTLGSAVGQEKKAPPVVKDSFAAKQINPYETWKVYFNAADPDGDMLSVFAIIDSPGVGQYPLGITRLKRENQKEISGYVYLTTFGVHSSLLNFAHLTLTLWVRDKSGNFSEPVNFPLSINTTYIQESPPAGKFAQEDLGPIMIRLRPSWDSARFWPTE